MKLIATGLLTSSLLIISACGGSSGNSNGTNQCKTTPTVNANNTNFVRIPGGTTTPPTTNNPNVPAVPTTPATDKQPDGTAAACADKPQNPGNLGGTPNNNNTPIANNPTFPGVPTLPNNPNVPNTPPNNGGNRTPAVDTAALIGEWDFFFVQCDNGVTPAVLQRLNEMRQNNEFYSSLTITKTSIEEYRWVKLNDQATNQDMMCSIKQSSTYSAMPGTALFRVSTSSAAYEDAGGAQPCNLGGEPAAIFDNVVLAAQQDVMVRGISNSSE
ncbi:MAG: hypothetical protein RLZZ488_628 [Pseudomonadota bacterium]